MTDREALEILRGENPCMEIMDCPVLEKLLQIAMEKEVPDTMESDIQRLMPTLTAEERDEVLEGLYKEKESIISLVNQIQGKEKPPEPECFTREEAVRIGRMRRERAKKAVEEYFRKHPEKLRR